MAEPVLSPMEQTCQAIGQRIGEVLDAHSDANPDSPRIGFVLLTFTFGDDGWMTYVSNAQREDVVRSMYEFIAKQPTTQHPETTSG